MEREHKPEMTFSFVAPVFNEQDGLEQFHQRLTGVAERLGEPYEIIYVNDGSNDSTGDVLKRLSESDPRVRVVEFSRNFGHQVAVTAGYDFACGRAVISLDSDCQHPPEMIPDLIARWREGFEVVYTVRKDAGGIAPARWLIRLCGGPDLADMADFRLLDRKAVDALLRMREHARSVRGLVKWIGFRQTGIPYVPERRKTGKSNRTLGQMMRLSSAGLFNFSMRPLRLTALLGGLMMLVAVIYAAAAMAFQSMELPLHPLAHLAMLIVGLFGLQFVLMSLMGEYIGRVFDEAKRRPLYIVRQTIGFAEEEEDGLKPPLPLEKKPPNYAVFT